MLKNKRRLNKKNPLFWLALFGLILMLGIFLYRFLSEYFHPNSISEYQGVLGRLWFGCLQYFTNQSNLLLLVFFVLFLLFYSKKLFNNNVYLVYTSTYIGIVFTVFWFILTPLAIFFNEVNYNKYKIIEYGLFHFLSPIYFFIFVICYYHFSETSQRLKLKYGKHILLGMIYPCIYATYLVTINFVKLPTNIFNPNVFNPDSYALLIKNPYISVYSIPTNFNHLCYNIQWATDKFELIVNPNDVGSLKNLLFLPFAFLLFCLIFWINIFFNNFSNRKK